MGYSRKTNRYYGELDNITVFDARYKGKEIVVIDDDEDTPPSDDAPFVREGTFRLMGLPAELRVYIYQFLLPYNKVLKFNTAHCTVKRMHPITNANEWSPEWYLAVVSTRTCVPSVPVAAAQGANHIHMSRYNRVFNGLQSTGPPPRNEIQTQLLVVNKEISKEARAVLYASNTYEFNITSNPHSPVSLHSPQIFGPLGTPERLPLLRNLRSIHLEVSLTDTTHWVVKRQRARLEYFISVLKEHADDADTRSLLEKLTVHLGPVQRTPTFSRCRIPQRPLHPTAGLNTDRYMFGLESLAQLSGIKDVQVSGVPEWYAECLRLCVQGKGGEVEPTEWPEVRVKKAKKGAWGQARRGKERMVSTRKWWQPVLNWVEFAERKGVEVPGDVGRYWVDEE